MSSKTKISAISKAKSNSNNNEQDAEGKISVNDEDPRSQNVGNAPESHDEENAVVGLIAVSYTHLTLPTIYSV